jgi:hypothetical protein
MLYRSPAPTIAIVMGLAGAGGTGNLEDMLAVVDEKHPRMDRIYDL